MGKIIIPNDVKIFDNLVRSLYHTFHKNTFQIIKGIDTKKYLKLEEC